MTGWNCILPNGSLPGNPFANEDGLAMDALIIPHQPACVSHGDIPTHRTLQKEMKLPVLKSGLSCEPPCCSTFGYVPE